MESRQKPVCGLALIESCRFKGITLKGPGRQALLKETFTRRSDVLINFVTALFDTRIATISSREEAGRAIKQFVAEDVDFVLVVYSTYAEDLPWIRLLRDLPGVPMLFFHPTDMGGVNLATEDTFIDFLMKTALVGGLEASGSALRQQRAVRVIVGGMNETTKARLRTFAAAARAVHALRNARFGLLRSFNEVMYSTYVDPYNFFVRLGPEICFIDITQLQRAMDALPPDEVRSYVADLTHRYRAYGTLDPTALHESARASLGCAALARDMNLDALTINDVDMALHQTIGLRPGFYPPYFNQTGAVFVPEGDLGTAAIVFAEKVMTGRHISFIEPFHMDEASNTFVAGHGGPQDHTDPAYADHVLLAPDARYADGPFKHAGAPFAWYKIPEGLKTIAHFSEVNGRYKLVTFLAESLPGQHFLEGYSHARFAPQMPVVELFEKIFEAGTNQHFALVEGDVRPELTEFAFLSGAEHHRLGSV
jgi:L-arabinose isomerase